MRKYIPLLLATLVAGAAFTASAVAAHGPKAPGGAAAGETQRAEDERVRGMHAPMRRLARTLRAFERHCGGTNATSERCQQVKARLLERLQRLQARLATMHARLTAKIAEKCGAPPTASAERCDRARERLQRLGELRTRVAAAIAQIGG